MVSVPKQKISFSQWLVICGMLGAFVVFSGQVLSEIHSNTVAIDAIKIENKVFKEQNWNDHRGMYTDFKGDIQLLREEKKISDDQFNKRFDRIESILDRNFRGISKSHNKPI
jgi:hypothetical protein